MKTLFLIVAVLGTAVVSVGQACDLSLKRAPTLRGLKLGLSERDVSSLLNVKSLSDIPAHDSGGGGFSKFIRPSPEFLRKTPNFNDVLSLRLDFYRETLVRIDLRYSQDAVKFKDVKEFVEILSEKFDFDRSLWQFETPERAVFRCREFELSASSNNDLTLVDLSAEKQKQKEFRP